MRRMTARVAVALLSLSLATPPGVFAQDLSADGQRVVDYLRKDWQRKFSSTTIPHAMQFMGMQPDDDLRLEIVGYLRAHDGLARNLQWWGANNYLFTNLEKRLAKYLILLHDKGDPYPSAAAAAAALEISEQQLRARLAFMQAGGFLRGADNDLGFALADGFRRWAGPLQHNFHTVRIEGQAPLDVW